jgi:hypothetical protein
MLHGGKVMASLPIPALGGKHRGGELVQIVGSGATLDQIGRDGRSGATLDQIGGNGRSRLVA